MSTLPKYANETSEKDLERIIGSDLIIGRAYDELNRYNWTKEERFAYDQAKKHTDDYLSSLKEKFFEGRLEGIHIGKEEGIKIGAERGKEEGRKAREIEVAKNLLNANVAIDIISQITGLPISEIKKLQKDKDFSN